MAKTALEQRRHVVKRYGMTRLYDTTALRYLDAAELRSIVHMGAELVVFDANTGEDITAASLTLGAAR